MHRLSLSVTPWCNSTQFLFLFCLQYFHGKGILSSYQGILSTFWLQLRSFSWDNCRHRHTAAALRDGFLKPTVDWIQVEIWFNLFEKSIGKIKLTQHHQSFVLSDLWGLPEFSICPTCFSSWRWTWGSKYEGVNIKLRWLKSRTTSDLLRLLVRFSLSSSCLQVDFIQINWQILLEELQYIVLSQSCMIIELERKCERKGQYSLSQVLSTFWNIWEIHGLILIQNIGHWSSVFTSCEFNLCNWNTNLWNQSPWPSK